MSRFLLISTFLMISGCGSLMVRSSAANSSLSAFGCPFWGVRQNIGYLTTGAAANGPHPAHISFFRHAAPVIDLPASLVLDTLLLPADVLSPNPYKDGGSALLDYSGCKEQSLSPEKDQSQKR